MLRFSLRDFAASLPRRRCRISRRRRSRIKLAIVEAMEDRILLSGMAPFAMGESYLVPYDEFNTSTLSEASVLANDMDMEGDPMTAVLHANVSHGSLTLNSNGHFVYTPDEGYSGSDSFQYKAFDGTGYSSATTVSLNVVPAFTARTNLDDRPSTGIDPQTTLGTSLMTGGVEAAHIVAPGIALVYQSTTTDPAPVVAVETDFQKDTMFFLTPSNVEVDLLLDTIQGPSIYYTGTLSNGFGLPFAHQVDASSLPTGRYEYEMTVVGNYSNGQTSSRTFTGSTHVVNLSSSEFGDGWWLQELDRLVIDAGGMLHVTGDGVASWFEDNSGTFVSPAGPLAHSTLVENQNGTYTLTDKYGNEANFDADGLLTQRVDRNGNTRTYTYTDADSDTLTDELWKITDPFSRVTTFAYTSGLLSSVTDIDGRVTTIAHDGSDRLTGITRPDPDGGGAQSAPVTTYGYDGSTSRLDSVTDPLSRETTVTYNFAGRGDEITYADEATSSLAAWQTRGLVDTSVEGTSGNPADLFLPDNPLLTSGATFIDPLQHESDYALDRFGNLTALINVLGERTDYERNANGQVTKMTLPDPVGQQAAPVTSYQYDTDGNLTQITNPDSTTIVMVYSAANFLTSRKDELDRETTYTYDSYGNMLTMTDPLGKVTSYDYDAAGRLIEVTLPDPDGGGALAAPVTEYEYDAYGRLVETTNPDTTTVTYAYDTADRVTSITDELSRVTSFTYDELDRLLTVTLPDPDGGGAQTAPVTTYTYDAVGNRLTQVDALSNTTSYEYDERHRLTEVTLPDPDGGGAQTAPVLQRAYNDAGWLTSTTDALGNVTTYGYDYVGRLTTVTQPDPDGAGGLTAPVTSYLLDKLGRVTRITDPLGNYTDFEYDSRGRLTKRTDPDPDGFGGASAPITQWAYDDAGQLTSVTDPLSRVTSFVYDDNGRLTTTTLPDPDGGGGQSAPVITRGYDHLGRLTTLTDPLGNVTTYTYDITSRLTQTTLPDPDGTGALTSPVTTYAYDDAGQLTSLTDPVGNVTTWTYDNLGRTLTETNELLDALSWEYDALGNVIAATDRMGRVREFDYDNLQRLTQELWKEGSTTVNTIDYTWDAGSRLTAIEDDVSAYAYTYDNLGRVIEVDNAGTSVGPNVILYSTYDAAGRRTSVRAEVDSTGDFINTFDYDNLGRMTRVQQVAHQTGNSVEDKQVDFTYNAGGQFSTITRYADITQTDLVATTTFTYDQANRLVELSHDQGTTVLAAYEWTYDTGGRLTSTTSPDGTTAYTYDDTGQLIAADHSYQSDESYEYDANGNRTNTGYSTGDNNQLLSDGTHNYTYDDNGNRTRRTEISTGAYVVYEWDHRNRLTSVTFRDSSDVKLKEVNYVYDAFDRRIAEDVDDNGDGTPDRGERYVHDGTDIVLVFDDTDAIIERFLYGPQVDQPLASENSSGDVLWLFADQQGTIRDVAEYDAVSGDTTVVNHLKYDSYGNITSQTNTTLEPRHTYTGREWDADAGLFYYRARWYDPVVGQFIGEDPLGFGGLDANLSRYVGNGATNFIDPTGWQRNRNPAGFVEPPLDLDQRPDIQVMMAVMNNQATHTYWQAFGASLSSSLSSIGTGFRGMYHQVWTGDTALANTHYQNAYVQGPLGQTAPGSAGYHSGYYYGTRGFLSLATAASVAALSTIAIGAFAPTMSIGSAVPQGATSASARIGHFAWTTSNSAQWWHATQVPRLSGSFLPRILPAAGRLGYGSYFRTLTQVPILLPGMATYSGTASSCLTGAGYAWLNAGGAAFVAPILGTGAAAGITTMQLTTQDMVPPDVTL